MAIQHQSMQTPPLTYSIMRLAALSCLILSLIACQHIQITESPIPVTSDFNGQSGLLQGQSL